MILEDFMTHRASAHPRISSGSNASRHHSLAFVAGRIGFVLAAAVVSSLVARDAAASDPRTEDLFAGAQQLAPADPQVAEKASQAALRVASLCRAPAGERMGASPAESAACDAATAGLVRQGKAATAAILAQLDDQRTPWYARVQLRAALGRTGDDGAVAALVRAAERAAAREAAKVESGLSTDDVAEMLGQATYENPAESAPWEREGAGDTVKAADESAEHTAKAWRAWLDQNPTPPAEGFRKAGERKALKEAQSQDPAVAYLAARRLAAHKNTRQAAITTFKRIANQSGVPEQATQLAVGELSMLGIEYTPRRQPKPAIPTPPKGAPSKLPGGPGGRS
jgi:hypothetical protein